MAKTWTDLSQAQRSIAGRKVLDGHLAQVITGDFVFPAPADQATYLDLRDKQTRGGLSGYYLLVKVWQDTTLRQALIDRSNVEAQAGIYIDAADQRGAVNLIGAVDVAP